MSVSFSVGLCLLFPFPHASRFLLQGGRIGEEPAEVEGADSKGQPLSARSLFHR